MDTFSDLFRYVKIYQTYLGRRMYVLFGFTLATAVASALGITMLLPLLEASQEGGSAGGMQDMGTAERFLHDVLAWFGIADSLMGILAAIALIFIGKGLLAFARGGYQGYLQAQLLRELKTRLFDAYSGMDYRYYIQQNAGHFINVNAD